MSAFQATEGRKREGQKPCHTQHFCLRLIGQNEVTLPAARVTEERGV